MRYIKYLRYVLRHKWYVLIECFKRGIYWRGITHDNSKFLLSEFLPYANFFYGGYKKMKDMNMYEKTYCKCLEDFQDAFDLAWLKHQKRNPHHWQYWILVNDQDAKYNMYMPKKYATEMICDWIGAGKAIRGKDAKTIDWYNKNKEHIQLHSETRNLVEKLLEVK